MGKYVIGVDIGTTSTKSVLFDRAAKAIDYQTIGYPLDRPSQNAAVQDSDRIFRAVIDTVKQLIAKNNLDSGEIICLSFSAAMHSLIMVDRSGQPLTPSLTWADNRSSAWADRLKNEYDGHKIYLRTGTPIHPMSPLVKLMWLRHSNDLWQQAHKFISIKEYVFWQLFQEYVVDYSIASATGLFNFNSLTWDREALSITQIKSSQLSQPVPTTTVFRSMQAQYAREMGIDKNTPVVIGANDGVLANLGIGAIAPGIVAMTVGTSGAVRTTIKQPQTDAAGSLFCYALTEDYWVVGGAVNNGGIILRWIKEQLATAEVETAKLLQQDPYDLITAIAETIPAGAEGLIFHPYLAGERSPLWDANARGSFFGLSLRHNKAHLIRAILEGVIYNLYSVFQAVETIVGEVTSIKAAGGFARSSLWQQMVADIFEREIMIPESYESSSLGAAILGLYALEEIPSLSQFELKQDSKTQRTPIPDNVAKYQQILPIYSRLLNSFKNEYQAIALLQQQSDRER